MITTDRLLIAGTTALAVGFFAIWWPLGLIAAGVIMLAAAVLLALSNVRTRGPEA